MYAVIKTGGKQYRVETGNKIKIEQVPAEIGSEFITNQVLMLADGDKISIGKPLVNGAMVKATIFRTGPTR